VQNPQSQRNFIITEKRVDLKNCQEEPIGIGGWPPISTWISPPPLGSNGLHFVEFPHQVREFLLNLAPGEPLSLVQELPYLDNPITPDPLLETALDLCVHYLIYSVPCSGLSYVGVKCFAISEVSNNGGKYGRRRPTLNIGCNPRKGGVFSSKELSPTTLVIV
jgi:hypothetical protein